MRCLIGVQVAQEVYEIRIQGISSQGCFEDSRKAKAELTLFLRLFCLLVKKNVTYTEMSQVSFVMQSSRGKLTETSNFLIFVTVPLKKIGEIIFWRTLTLSVQTSL